jgi:hypothetical protein
MDIACYQVLIPLHKLWATRREATDSIVLHLLRGRFPTELSTESVDHEAKAASDCSARRRRRDQGIALTTPPSTRSAAPVVAEACGEQT